MGFPIIPPNNSTLFDTPISNGLIPAEGPKALGCVAPFTNTNTDFTINLLLTQALKFMDSVQAVFVDNSLNGQRVTLTTSLLKQPLKVPANSQAYLPILVGKDDTITVHSTGAVNVGLIFLNVPVAAAVWAV